MQKIVVICGPTSSGKTSLALKLALEIDAELISSDSRQVYRTLDIGTNKGKLTESSRQYFLEGIPLHLVNLRNPDESYNVFDFKNDFDSKSKEIASKGKNIILVGGTGLYIDAVYRNYQLSDSIENKYSELGINELRKLYVEKYPDAFEQLNYSDQNNPRRLSMHLSKLDAGIELKANQKSELDFIFIYPNFEREELKAKIDARVDEMFKEGLVLETKNALDKYGSNCVALQGIGYKEVVEFINGKYSEEECVKLVKYAHNQYAKRQITWFEGAGRAYPLNRVNGINDTIELVRAFLSNT